MHELLYGLMASSDSTLGLEKSTHPLAMMEKSTHPLTMMEKSTHLLAMMGTGRVPHAAGLLEIQTVSNVNY